jgi:hypothetical protein
MSSVKGGSEREERLLRSKKRCTKRILNGKKSPIDKNVIARELSKQSMFSTLRILSRKIRAKTKIPSNPSWK